MKCRITRDDLQISPAWLHLLKPSLRAQVVERKVWENGRNTTRHFWQLNAIVDLPDCYMLVRQGCAVPADDECERKADRTPLQMVAAQEAYQRELVARIEFEDDDLYTAGVILGYKPDAMSDSAPEDKYLPGPNWHLYAEMRPEADDEDEEDE